jgi:phenylacetate-CoA ligase
MLTTLEVLEETSMQRRLSEAVPRWLSQIPLYRNRKYRWPVAGAEGASDLPFITKKDIRDQFPHNFLPNGTDLDQLVDNGVVELEHTSGTSEARTPLILPVGWWAEQEMRALRLNPLVAKVLDAEPNARRITLSSPVCNGEICFSGVPSCAERTLDSTRFLSLSRFPFLWGDADLKRMARETTEWEPRFLDVDPVYGVVFAFFCERQGIRLPSVRFIIATYEFVSRAHRRILERAFGVPVFNLYGSTETGHLLMEMPDGTMRPSYGTASLDLVHVDNRGIGELIVTTTSNDYMPLLRYRIGDLARRHTTPYATRYEIHGRAKDSVLRSDGTRLTVLELDEIIGSVEGIAHYQVTVRKDDVLIRFVPDRGNPAPADLENCCRMLQETLGKRVIAEQVHTLLAESSGKFRICYPA